MPWSHFSRSLQYADVQCSPKFLLLEYQSWLMVNFFNELEQFKIISIIMSLLLSLHPVCFPEWKRKGEWLLLLYCVHPQKYVIHLNTSHHVFQDEEKVEDYCSRPSNWGMLDYHLRPGWSDKRELLSNWKSSFNPLSAWGTIVKNRTWRQKKLGVNHRIMSRGSRICDSTKRAETCHRSVHQS